MNYVMKENYKIVFHPIKAIEISYFFVYFFYLIALNNMS